MDRFIGREKELKGLKDLLKKRTSSLVVIRGRRRIGKSRLAEEFSRSFANSYLLTGIPPVEEISKQDQRDEFAGQLRNLGVPVKGVNDWRDLLISLASHTKEGRILIILDEITWMGSLDPLFLPKLKTIWDTHFKKNPQLVLVISGSNSAWIDKNILSSTGFVGRLSHKLLLRELPIDKCGEFWGNNSDHIDPYEKFKILSVTGGIPRYLEEIKPHYTAEQNLFAMCYEPSGILFTEFDEIFSDLFQKRSDTYKQILIFAATKRPTMDEISQDLGRTKGGRLGSYLNELVEAGFLARDSDWNIGQQREDRLGRYRISDNYVRFYLRYIEPYRNHIKADKISSLPNGWTSIMGLQFENLVAGNYMAIFRTLNLRSDDVVWSGSYIQKQSGRYPGCQIDYLIQTKHRVLYICEVKFSQEKIGASVVKEVREKSEKLAKPRGFSARHVLIHVNGVTEQVEWEDFFSDIIDFGQLLSPGPRLLPSSTPRAADFE